MRTIYSILVFLLILSCSRPPADYEAALFLYNQNELEEALPVFEEVVSQQPDNLLAQAYLAEIHRRFGQKEKAVALARNILTVEPCHAFAHTIIAEASNPLVGEWDGADAETTWVHLLEAATCDPKDGYPWLMLWGESVRRGDRSLISRSAEKMIENGFFANALLSYTEWVLRSLPENAIIITNGDMDTYPMVALQEVEELRQDVVVVNRGMLNKAWCARYLRDMRGLPLPYSDDELDELSASRRDDGSIDTPSDQIVQGWIGMWKEGKMRNPVTIAMTVSTEYDERFNQDLQYAGAYRIVRTSVSDGPDLNAIRRGLDSFEFEDFLGPWVSDQDRSPVRRVGTKNIVRNVIYAAITLAEEMRGQEPPEDATRWISFAENLDMQSDLGPVYQEQIRALQTEGSN